MSIRIHTHDRIVPAIGKEICSRYIAGRYLPIRVHKPPHFRVIISAVEVVQSRFGVVVISAVAQGVDRAEGGGGGAVDLEQLAERAVGILDNAVAVRVQQGEHVAAEVAEVIHRCAATGHAVGAAVRVIGEIERRVRVGLLSEHLRAVQRIAGRDTVHRFLRADPVGVALCVYPRRGIPTRV